MITPTVIGHRLPDIDALNRQLPFTMESSGHLFERLKVCIVVPTYNNANTLAALIRDLKEFQAHIIVVNDGSTDETESVLG